MDFYRFVKFFLKIMKVLEEKKTATFVAAVFGSICSGHAAPDVSGLDDSTSSLGYGSN